MPIGTPESTPVSDFFPVFVNLRNQLILIIGGGNVAERKAQALFQAGSNITLVAPRICQGIRTMTGISLRERPVEERDLDENWRLVVLATDHFQTQEQFAILCQKRRLWVNRVDSPATSDFITGSRFSRPPFVGAIIASGTPGLAAIARERIETALDPALCQLASLLNEVRPLVQNHWEDPPQRPVFFRTWATKEALARVETEGIEVIRREVLQCLSS